MGSDEEKRAYYRRNTAQQLRDHPGATGAEAFTAVRGRVLGA